ncbi:aromatic amino acid transporter [Pseudomonas oryzihabitans]|uniref:amino acid permease n=1 Tax=Pseudomonas oryzihabitans TaxID=47885 RepID=UPI0007362194|nr:amino acid permease [Pseudomonas psychrotolerans]KTT55549.1 aromatic amino acid transporter [Pseudomonas psychrotolerans]
MSTASPSLQRRLKPRHLNMIAIGGSIGTGLFVASGATVATAGPGGALAAYALIGLMVYFLMTSLGEMAAYQPVSGSFSIYGSRFVEDGFGFALGWNYWYNWAVTIAAELVAAQLVMGFWFPEVPGLLWSALFLGLMFLLNAVSVRGFGESEFWFALIKVVAILGMMAFGLWLLVSGSGGPEASVSNLWSHGGFLPNGWSGLFAVLAIIMFSFGGLELVGITAAEADQPRSVIPKAINQVVWRILIFYVGALTILLSLHPWDELVRSIGAGGDDYAGSPFVQTFALLGSDTAAHLLNFVVLTAALSVYNSGVYCTSRMLYGLAEQGDAPRALLRTNRRGVPLLGIAVSSAVTLLCVVVNYLLPQNALELLMSLVVASLVIAWALISLTHLKFRAAQRQAGRTSHFPAFWSPFANWLCLAFVGMILVLMLRIPGIAVSVYAIPVWLAFLFLCYRLRRG